MQDDVCWRSFFLLFGVGRWSRSNFLAPAVVGNEGMDPYSTPSLCPSVTPSFPTQHRGVRQEPAQKGNSKNRL